MHSSFFIHFFCRVWNSLCRSNRNSAFFGVLFQHTFLLYRKLHNFLYNKLPMRVFLAMLKNAYGLKQRIILLMHAFVCRRAMLKFNREACIEGALFGVFVALLLQHKLKEKGDFHWKSPFSVYTLYNKSVYVGNGQ